MDVLGKALMAMAVLIFVVGALIYLFGRVGGGFLPGDIVVRRGSFTFAFPIVTMLLISLLLTLVLNVFFRH